MDSDECTLVAQAKTDPEAFGALYDRYVGEVYGFVRARLHNAAAAEDVTAEVFFSALRAMPRYQDRGRPFSCWLLRIASNAVSTYYRREHAHLDVTDEIPDRAASVEGAVLRDLEMAGLWQLVAELPPLQRQAMQLRFQEDRSARDAARIMRRSEAAVKLLIYRAVSRLRSELGVATTARRAPSVRAAT
jgi:RNA polymerase sigma-70 factor (ECF subfamily)